MSPNHLADYTEALDELLSEDSPLAPSPRVNVPAIRFTPARPILEAQLALCGKILASPVFERPPELVLALQDSCSCAMDTWISGVFARLEGTEAGDVLARLSRSEALAVLVLGMLAGFEHAAQRPASSIWKAVRGAKLT